MRGVQLSQPLAWLSLAAYASAQVVMKDVSFGHDGKLSPNGRGIPGWSVSSENHQIQILSDHLILTPPIPGHARGAAWSDASASSSEWSAEFEFRAAGQDQAAGNLMETGSLNIWFVKDKHAVDRNTIYTVGKWDGLAIVLDQYGGGGGKVRGFLNDGEKDYSQSSNPAPFAFGHCDYSYRNLGRPSKIRINHQNGLTVSVDDRECFKTDKVQLPSGYSYGITAATGDNPDSFEIFKFVVYSGTPNKQQQQNQPPPQQSQQPTLQKLDRLPGSPEMMADKNAEEIKGTDAQFEDLHNRLQGMTHQTANIFVELDSISRKIDGKLDDVQRQIIGSIPASPQTLTAGDFADLKRKVEAIERTVQQIQRDVEGKDYAEHISNLQMAVEGIRGTVSEHLPNTVKTIIHGTAPRMGLFVGVIVAVQLALAAAFVLYKRRRNSMPKKYL
ncbi:concanavalin A-like lectin/glucanase [Teratosphaeria nubilosa]|uniref:Concanavalin A-like lectin/glucanase n=1 Tax=Teratosphaeria nubilosa TaxID=161662 RepID=A0A6G1LJL8_9PEZI|nr:concanavalin A-like lectin/glucanase [Teratosphaeria nubilosa]